MVIENTFLYLQKEGFWKSDRQVETNTKYK